MPRALHRFLIPLAALLTLVPLVVHGGSCGHDEVFHVQGWFDAAAQLRHLQYPHWSFTSAWSAGEPRFLFYPPLSWLLGALLTLVLPPQGAVYAYLFFCLSFAGFTMYRLAAHFATPSAALVAAILYVANPYMLFNAFERSAFAELLAAAWVPLLLLAALRARPTVRSTAIALALLWLTNAPAAVMCSYAFALLATLRVGYALFNSPRQGGRIAAGWLAATYVAGTALGLALPAFYLIPAAYERRFIQTSMALVTNMRIQDNFFFDHTLDHGHNGVNLQISLLGVTLLGLTILAVLALLGLHVRARSAASTQGSIAATPAVPLAALTAALTLMLLPASLPLWNHIPELAFLQFPWRLLTIVSAVLTFTLGLLLNRLPTRKHSPAFLSLLFALGLGLLALNLYAQFCQPNDRPVAIAGLLRTHHGFAPTDEYTPLNADSDVLRSANAAYWLAPADAPNTPSPHTLPTPSELDPSLQSDDTPVPPEQAISDPAPAHLSLNLPQPETLILNLRDYPTWEVTRNAETHPAQLQRDDGLLAIALPAGTTTLDIHWHTTSDQLLGIALSSIALLVLLALCLPIFRLANPRTIESLHTV